MNIRPFPIADIHPYENNPRKNEAAVDAVAASIKQFGFLVPLVIDKDHTTNTYLPYPKDLRICKCMYHSGLYCVTI